MRGKANTSPKKPSQTLAARCSSSLDESITSKKIIILTPPKRFLEQDDRSEKNLPPGAAGHSRSLLSYRPWAAPPSYLATPPILEEQAFLAGKKEESNCGIEGFLLGAPAKYNSISKTPHSIAPQDRPRLKLRPRLCWSNPAKFPLLVIKPFASKTVYPLGDPSKNASKVDSNKNAAMVRKALYVNRDCPSSDETTKSLSFPSFFAPISAARQEAAEVVERKRPSPNDSMLFDDIFKRSSSPRSDTFNYSTDSSLLGGISLTPLTMWTNDHTLLDEKSHEDAAEDVELSLPSSLYKENLPPSDTDLSGGYTTPTPLIRDDLPRCFPPRRYQVIRTPETTINGSYGPSYAPLRATSYPPQFPIL